VDDRCLIFGERDLTIKFGRGLQALSKYMNERSTAAQKKCK
jgi:hypothetical protein